MWHYKVQWGSDGGNCSFGKIKTASKKEALDWIDSWYNHEALVLELWRIG